MYVVIDLETTGLDSSSDEIIEIACVKIDRSSCEEIDRYHSFVKPDKDIPELISQITNIFASDVENAPRFSDIQDEVEDFIDGLPIIGHNISFDTRFLEKNGVDIRNSPTIDTFFLANFLCFDEKSLNLGYLCESFGIILENAHRAIDDTLATAKLFKALIDKMGALTESEKEILHFIFTKTQDVGVHILRDEYLKNISKKDDLEHVESYLEGNIKSHILDISDIHSSQVKQINHEFLEEISGFESRGSQKTMIDKVDIALSKGEKLVVEAPTGIGKTFAYLLPAIKHSLNFNQPVHISTSTKALQDQIYFKDLHFLAENYPHKFSYCKLKGKRNYFSISSFFEFLETYNSFSAGQGSFVLKVLFWAAGSATGELDELDFYGEEFGYIGEIHAGNSNVFSESNLHKDLEFAVIARNRAKKSNIIITNNHILFQDIVSEGAILGGVKNLIIDEAHALEDVVTQSLKKTISYEGVHKLILRISKKYIKYNISVKDFELKSQQLLFDLAELMSLLEGKIFEKFSLSQKYKTLLLTGNDIQEHPRYEIIAKKNIDIMQDLLQQLGDIPENKTVFFQSEAAQINDIISTLSNVFLSPDDSRYIYYMQHDDSYGTRLFMTVLRPGDFLRQNLWPKLESVILTSATLQMQDDFKYISTVLSLDNFEFMQLPSDFDYSSNSLLYLPDDLGDIRSNMTEIKQFLEEFFLRVQGNTLMLCTAFASIRDIFSSFKSSFEEKGIHLLAQSISGSKHKQIEFFKKHSDNSILLGTDSLWEGIDIPGKDLQYLVIHKIPFSVPSDPIFMARSQLYDDSFTQYAIPKAILKLKQGFGRLIRTKKDTGVVVFLDNRIFKTRWGESFYNAFPSDIKIRKGSTNSLLHILSKPK